VPEGCTVISESTVYPGGTEEFVAETLTENGLTVGENIFVAFSPERIDPGNEQYGPTDIPKLLGGVTLTCGDHAETLYGPVFDEIVRVDSATEAELVKLLENTFRAVNIGLINELAQIAHHLDVNTWTAIDAAATKPFVVCHFILVQDSVAIVSRSTRCCSRDRPTRRASKPGFSVWPIKSTGRCRNMSSSW